MKVILHVDKCIGCGMCETLAPDICSLKSGVVSFQKNQTMWNENDWKTIRQAATACPNEVIEIINN